MPKLDTGSIKFTLADGSVVAMKVVISSDDGIPPRVPREALSILTERDVDILGEAVTDERISVQIGLFEKNSEE